MIKTYINGQKVACVMSLRLALRKLLSPYVVDFNFCSLIHNYLSFSGMQTVVTQPYRRGSELLSDTISRPNLDGRFRLQRVRLLYHLFEFKCSITTHNTYLFEIMMREYFKFLL